MRITSFQDRVQNAWHHHVHGVITHGECLTTKSRVQNESSSHSDGGASCQPSMEYWKNWVTLWIWILVSWGQDAEWTECPTLFVCRQGCHPWKSVCTERRACSTTQMQRPSRNVSGTTSSPQNQCAASSSVCSTSKVGPCSATQFEFNVADRMYWSGFEVKERKKGSVEPS